MEDDTVTIRERDSRNQYRINAASAVQNITDKLKDINL
jgi:glycyl-tRNA synthetase (class II)